MLTSHWYANGDEGLSNIFFVSQGLLLKMLITHEPHGKF